jgi:surfactin synthase thioesterase subunit
MTPLALPEEYPDHPDRTILVVAHAGGGAAVANPLRAAGPPGWLVAGVMFGGRESRFLDDSPASLADLVDDTVTAATEVRHRTGSAPVLVGQCSGALVAWLAAVELSARGPAPAGLVVVSRSAPSWPGQLPDVTTDDAELLRQVVAMGGVPADVADLPELLELLLPPLRADFAALAQWSAEHAESVPPLTAPALALFAPGDAGCPTESIEVWRDQVPDLTVSHVSGRHLLLGENPAGVARGIAEWLPTTETGRARRAEHV